MNTNKITFYILLFVSQSFYCAEVTHRINKWHDIGSFAGKMVVFQSQKCCFNGKYCYRVDVQQNIKVALIGNRPIKNEDGMGYPMSRLLTSDAPLRDANLILTDHELENASLIMREPNIYESREIQAAVKDQKARFEHLKSQSSL